MVYTLRSSWWVTVLRGLTALGFALLLLAHVHTPARAMSAVGDDKVFGTYVLADGVLVALAVVVVIRCQGQAPPLALVASAAGASFGIYLLSTPRVSSLGLTLIIGIWALAIGLLALDCGYVLYRTTPGPWRVLALDSGMRLRRGAATECGMLLAGAVAVAFAVIVLTLAATGRTISLAIVGLFAAAFGYLQLRVGLTLGVLALAATESIAGAGNAVRGDSAATPEGGMA